MRRNREICRMGCGSGPSGREATRCLKRYLARNIYRLLEHPPITT